MRYFVTLPHVLFASVEVSAMQRLLAERNR
jgi:hypothetical protein